LLLLIEMPRLGMQIRRYLSTR